MTEAELLKETDSLLSDFRSLEVVKRYQALKKALDENQHLQEINEKRINLQKGLRYLNDYKKDECIKACKELQIAYDSDPLVINYREMKQQILELIEVLTKAHL